MDTLAVIDSIGTLRLSLPRMANATSQRRAAAAAALSAFGPHTRSASPRGERVVLVRHLNVRVKVGGSGDIPELAATAARNVESALRDALKTADRDGEVITFDSVAEYIVQFVEHYLNARGPDAWYFGPLMECAAPTLAATLSNLAEREPAIWPDVLDLLRQRGLTPRLLQRLSPADYELLYQSVPRPRRLTIDEARPLFVAASEIVSRVAGEEQPTAAAIQAHLALYLEEARAAPTSWSDAAALAHTVAEMLRWLVLRRRPMALEPEAVKQAVASFSWLNASILTDALMRASARSASAAVARLALSPNAALPRMNRTRALRYLAAARQCSLRVVPRDPRSAANDASALIEQVIATLRSHADLRVAGAIERVVLDAGFHPQVEARATAMITSLRAAAAVLSTAEAHELVMHLQRAVQAAGPPFVETDAAGLFLLIRPLIDLRVHGNAVPGFAEAAGVHPDDGAIEIFNHDTAATNDEYATMAAVRSNARLLGLDLERARDGNLAELALDLSCQQLMRWLHGFEKSSVDFVLRTLIQRSGAIQVPASGPVIVHWPGCALDVLLDRVGYLDPIEVVPWWAGRGLRWQR